MGRETLRTLFSNPIAVPLELVEYDAWNKQRDDANSHNLLDNAKQWEVFVIFREVKPNACVDKHAEHIIGFSKVTAISRTKSKIVQSDPCRAHPVKSANLAGL